MPSTNQAPLNGTSPNFALTAEPYDRAGFRRDLLPIIPPDAQVSIHSRNPAAISAGRGKLPGRFAGDGWVGFSNWTHNVSRPEDLHTWGAWNCGLGLQGRNFPALDVDVDVLAVADALEDLARRVLGPAPCRSAGSARRLLVYAGQGHRKRRLTFRLPGVENDQAVELLADGQFYVVEGLHKSGNMYEWEGGQSPAQVNAKNLTPITAAKLDEFFDRAVVLLKTAFGAEVTAKASRSRARAAGHKSLSFAPSLDALRDVVDAIPNNDEVDYDDWIHVGHAIHAASRGSEDGYLIFEDWSVKWGGDNTPELIREKWDGFDPKATGWNYLAQLAMKTGFNAAKWEFGLAELDVGVEAAKDEMFAHSVWVERVQAVMDLRTFDLLNREQFNARQFRVGEPASHAECAWAVFLKKGERRKSVKSITYRPGAPLFVFEPAERGECVNVWRPTDSTLPCSATEADAKPWLDHLAFLFPEAGERQMLINWLAWVAQNPEKKPNWGVLVGSQHQGNGKSILTKPVRSALGEHNVREVTVEDLSSGYTDWIAQAKLFIVEEMHSFERTSAMNRLKNFLALPPYTLRVNPKFGKQFEVPNILAGLFFTNHRNALALEKTDRRFLVLWTDALPRDERYYLDLLAWYGAGGAEKAARYLLDLDLEGFHALGRAPETPAKSEMRKQSRSRLDEWIEEGMAEGAELGTGPFGAAIVALEDLRQVMPDEVFGKAGRPSPIRFATAMRNAGAVPVDRVALGPVPRGVTPPRVDLQQARLYSLRDHQRFASADRADLASLYWEERLRAQGGSLDVDRLFAA
jgi:hypothetical protein